MLSRDIKQRLVEKLDASYNAYVQEWLGLDPMEMIERSVEIAATRLIYTQLREGEYNTDYLEYLLRFQNPLEVVRDKLMNEQERIPDDTMENVLWNLYNTGDAERDYRLEKAFNEAEQDNGVRMC
ncbi:MAG TPA: DUF3848 domain-containing protein [Ruminiclostridium sp.]|nr:DUF3848 domain-containing protein [Ruminiclostridium sp.]